MSAYRGEARTTRRARAAAGNVGDQIGTSADLSGKFYQGGLARDDIDQYYASHRVASSRRCRISHTRATKVPPLYGRRAPPGALSSVPTPGADLRIRLSRSPPRRRTDRILMAAILETLQLWVPGRHASFADFAVNATGAWVGSQPPRPSSGSNDRVRPDCIRKGAGIRGELIPQCGQAESILGKRRDRPIPARSGWRVLALNGPKSMSAFLPLLVQ